MSTIISFNKLFLLKLAKSKLLTYTQVTIFTKYLSTTRSKSTKFVQFTYKNDPENIRVGCLVDDGVVDFNRVDPCIPTTLLGILQNGALEIVKK